MRVIASMLVDKHGRIKHLPQAFKPNEADICVLSLSMGDVCEKSLYYEPLSFDENKKESITWTVKETMRRCYEVKANVVKIFTRIQDFYEEIDELQFAYIDDLGEDFNEEIDMTSLKMFCDKAKKEFLGEKNNIKFFRYTIDKS